MRMVVGKVLSKYSETVTGGTVIMHGAYSSSPALLVFATMA